MAIPTNRVADEAGKGIEALRHLSTNVFATATAGTALAIVPPYPVDYDIRAIVVTPADAIATHASNAVDVFIGTVAANVKAITAVGNTNLTGSAQVIFSATVVNARVTHGTPLTVRLVTGASNANLASVNVSIAIEIAIGMPGASDTTYGGYGWNGPN